MSLLDPVFNYCERTATGLLSEPFNAISNVSFFVAAWLLWRLYHKIPLPLREGKRGGATVMSASHPTPSPQGGRENLVLILLIAIVGVGSTLFHTFANRLTMLADVIPIAAFTFYYLWAALRRLEQFSKTTTMLCLALFVIAAVLLHQLPWTFNGSVDYFPCLGALLLIGWHLHQRSHPAAKYLLRAALVFVISLTFRSIDMAICPSLAIGTHFVWHTLNGVVLYLLTKPLIRVD